MILINILRNIENNFGTVINKLFILILILTILLGVGYFIIYKKILKGKKDLRKRDFFILVCLIVYIIMVMRVTLLNRSVGMVSAPKLHLFSSYKEAWNSFEFRKWIFIILNILMFVPLGILLPLANKKFRKFSSLAIIAFIMTLIIETTQLITGAGVFELDDIFNNFLGAVIGYGIIMAIITIIENKENKFKKSLFYLIPIILVGALTISIIGIYNLKEFGNLYIKYNYKINMKNIDIVLNTELDSDQDNIKAPIYKMPIYDEDKGKEIFVNFFKKENFIKDIITDSQDDMAIYSSKGDNSFNMLFYYNDGSYVYNNLNHPERAIEKVTKDENTILKDLEKFNITIPEVAVFSNMNDINEYQWSVDEYITEEYIQRGYLSVEYYSDEAIKSINNSIIKYLKVRDVSIKSKEEAYREFEQGKFRLYNSENVKNIEIEDIGLSYMFDSKEFYQPIYIFELKIDGINKKISIPALSS